MKTKSPKKPTYKQAVAKISSHIQKHPNDPRLDLDIRERAHLHLFYGNPHLARADLDTLATLDSRLPKRLGGLHSDLEYNAMGVTYWIEGHKDLALAFWRYTTEVNLLNRVAYACGGSGISAGLMLWFGAVHLNRKDDIRRAKALYEDRLHSTRWGHNLNGFRGLLAGFLVGLVSEPQLLSGTSHASEVCKAHFALAIRARQNRKYAAYRNYIRNAAEATNDLYECYNTFEYFLARHELKTLTR